jgi:RiboL-PSP-HEPN
MAADDTPTTGDPGLDNLGREELEQLREFVTKHMGPYLALQQESVQRVIRLLSFAMFLEAQLSSHPAATKTPVNRDLQLQADAVQEMIRAAVVLTHAYLEDYLRTVAEALLPESDEETLNAIPLVGLSGRAEKFTLGKLVRHKGKQVDEVLRESVREHLSRTTFNNKGDIVKLLEALGFELSRNTEKLEIIQEMIQRRHQIVHRADKVKPTHSATPVLQPIKSADASGWLKATHEFMLSLNGPLMDKLVELEQKVPKTVFETPPFAPPGTTETHAARTLLRYAQADEVPHPTPSDKK